MFVNIHAQHEFVCLLIEHIKEILVSILLKLLLQKSDVFEYYEFMIHAAMQKIISQDKALFWRQRSKMMCVIYAN